MRDPHEILDDLLAAKVQRLRVEIAADPRRFVETREPALPLTELVNDIGLSDG